MLTLNCDLDTKKKKNHEKFYTLLFCKKKSKKPSSWLRTMEWNYIFFFSLLKFSNEIATVRVYA